MNRPSWFSEESVIISNAPTCGIVGKGQPLFLLDSSTGLPVMVVDQETAEETRAIDDRLSIDVEALLDGKFTDTLRKVKKSEINENFLVPVYYHKSVVQIRNELKAKFPNHEIRSLGDLEKEGIILRLRGHGSPSKGVRVGHIPYIKVSDLRAGQVNINPTNMVLLDEASNYWPKVDYTSMKEVELKSCLKKADMSLTGDKDKLLERCLTIPPTSGLHQYDLISPERASSNIGQFCLLMPGQEQVVLTKEVIILRKGPKAMFDQFYLLWAMSLNSVDEQWKRIIFMQTNREDVGERYKEILIPIPSSKTIADKDSREFRDYFQAIAKARSNFAQYLTKSNKHNFHLTSE